MVSVKTWVAGMAVAASALLPVSAAVVQGINLGGGLNEVDSGAFSQSLNLVTGALSGFGLVTSFNNSGFAPAVGRELTYTFQGFALNEAQSSLNRLIFTGGTVNLFSDGTPDFNINNSATAGDSEFGTPFLSLAGSFFIDISNTFFGGTLSANLLSGFTALNVVGGAAAALFDTNSIGVVTSLGPPIVESMVDVTGSTSVVNYLLTNVAGGTEAITASAFATRVATVAFAAGINPNDPAVNVLNFFGTNLGLAGLSATGSADFNVRVIDIPEPGTLALVGLSLAGLGFVSRRRAKIVA